MKSIGENEEPSSDLKKNSFSKIHTNIILTAQNISFPYFSQQDADIFLDTTMVSFVGRLHNTRKTKERRQEIQGDVHTHCCYILIDWVIKSQIEIFSNVFLHKSKQKVEIIVNLIVSSATSR